MDLDALLVKDQARTIISVWKVEKYPDGMLCFVQNPPSLLAFPPLSGLLNSGPWLHTLCFCSLSLPLESLGSAQLGHLSALLAALFVSRCRRWHGKRKIKVTVSLEPIVISSFTSPSSGVRGDFAENVAVYNIICASPACHIAT